MTFDRLLVPTDFSASADAALNHAVAMANRFGATLHLLHVVNDLGTGLYGLGDAEKRIDQLKEEAESMAQKRLRGMARDTSAVDVHTAVAQRVNLGIADTIQEYVQGEPIDLVVMGTYGRSGLGRLVLGSVANTLIRFVMGSNTERVVRAAPCPVLTVSTASDPQRG